MENNKYSIGQINGFKYITTNNIKYFVGDFIKIQDNSNKWYIEDILNNNRICCVAKNGYSNVFDLNVTPIEDFYYKKDQKKYRISKKPRIYENDIDSVIVDSLGNKDILANMIFHKGKLYSKNSCVQVSKNNLGTEIDYLPSFKINGIFKQCEISKIYYNPNHLYKAYKIVKTSSGKYAVFECCFVCKKEYGKLLSSYARYFDANIPEKDHSIIALLNGDEILSNNDFIIGPKSGMLIKKDRIKKDDTYKMYPNGYYFPEFSNLQNKTNDISHNYKFGLDSNTHLITEGLKYTFGVEIEMADCCFPPHFLTDMNIKVEKDGSIRNTRGEKYGPEVITGVLKGDKGFEHLQYICNELAKRSELNYTCGIHTHIGNANFTNANIVMLFKLAKMLESEIFNMLPASRRKNEFCRELPKLNFNFNNCKNVMDLKIRIDNYYTELFTLAANCPPNDKVNKTKNHPKGAKVGYDHSNIRYCWLNFIPALFNTRNSNPPSYTIEFRPFNASTNFLKIKNWIKICMGIVNFAENYHKDIINNYIEFDNNKEPITLKNVMRKIYPKSHRKLNEFIDSRTQMFTDSSEDEDAAISVNLKIKELI